MGFFPFLTIKKEYWSKFILILIISLGHAHKYKIAWLKEGRVKLPVNGFESSSATECLCYFQVVH